MKNLIYMLLLLPVGIFAQPQPLCAQFIFDGYNLSYNPLCYNPVPHIDQLQPFEPARDTAEENRNAQALLDTVRKLEKMEADLNAFYEKCRKVNFETQECWGLLSPYERSQRGLPVTEDERHHLNEVLFKH
jgi:hypothetical protein